MSKAGDVQLSEGSILDLDSIMDVMDQSFDPSFGEAWTAPQCAGLMPMPGVWISLARVKGHLLGFALGRIAGDEAELLLLAVKKTERRQGIGRLLLDRFSLVAATRGARQLHLEVRDGNPAIHLYRRAGFKEVGRRRNYYSGREGQVYDALTLARPSTI